MIKTDWYNIYDLNVFTAKNIPCETFSAELEGRGVQTFTICKGLAISLIVDGVFLTPHLNGRNGFDKGNRTAYIDADNNLWVGYSYAA